jgi:hypothetical protein
VRRPHRACDAFPRPPPPTCDHAVLNQNLIHGGSLQAAVHLTLLSSVRSSQTQGTRQDPAMPASSQACGKSSIRSYTNSADPTYNLRTGTTVSSRRWRQSCRSAASAAACRLSSAGQTPFSPLNTGLPSLPRKMGCGIGGTCHAHALTSSVDQRLKGRDCSKHCACTIKRRDGNLNVLSRAADVHASNAALI